MNNLKQSLSELIAEWLDSESVCFEMNANKIADPMPRDKTDIHIKMADAAMNVFIFKVKIKT